MENQRNSDEGSPKRKRLSLSLKRRREQNGGSPRKRFARTSEEEMESLKTKLTSKNTKRSQVWALNVFKEWVGNNRELEIEYEHLWSETDKEKVCGMLCRFIAEAKQRSGEPYSPKSLLQLHRFKLHRFNRLKRLSRQQLTKKRIRCSAFKIYKVAP